MERIELDAADLDGLLDETGLFAGLDADVRRAVLVDSEMLHVRAGEEVIRFGEAAEAVFVVGGGRLEVQRPDAEDAWRTVGAAGRGDVVGETALVADRPRNATVIAVRDSRLLRIPAATFLAAVGSHPEALRHITGDIVDRHLDATAHPERRGRVRVVAVLPVNETADLGSVVTGLRRAAGAHDLALLDPEHVEEHLGASPTPTQLAELCDRLEADHQLLLLVGRNGHGLWNELCARQADLVVLVADTGGSHVVSPLEAKLKAQRERLRTRVELVLVHASSTDVPAGTPAWLRDRSIDRHHHLRLGDAAHVGRVGRLLLDRAVTVAFSGGGARGMAELGALRAFEEAGVPVDAVCGTSAGALIAATTARGWDAQQATDVLRRNLVDKGSPVDLTVPVVSIATGQKMTDRIRETAGAVLIEDAWLSCFLVSTNLTRLSPTIHRTGPAWLALRASMSIPGVFPPVAHEGEVLVDGGLVDNLPAGLLRADHPGSTLIAIDVSARKELGVGDLPDSGVVSGWRMVADRLDPRRRSPDVAGLVRVLTRLSELGHNDEVDDAADVVIRPDVEAFGMLDFRKFDQIVERGYQATIRALETDPSLARLKIP